MDNNKYVKFKHGLIASYVEYYLYREDEDVFPLINMPDPKTIENKGKNTNVVCFAHLYREITDKYKTIQPNRIAYKFYRNPNLLKKENCLSYLKLCKEHKLLPEYVDLVKVLKLNRLHLSLEHHTRNHIYIYLSVVRHMQSDPGFVGAVLELVKDGIDPFVAIAVGCSIAMSNSNHHFMPAEDTPYILEPFWNVNNVKVKLRSIYGLYKLLRDKKEDPIHLKAFNCNKYITSVGPSKTYMLLGNAVGKNFSEVLNASTFKKAETIFKKL